ncbi:hypothetical protein H311_03343 [Anncaliia algerae PRA109]|nr:hypothetical protein H311_03343 [Anncaliia algerae PRA109]
MNQHEILKKFNHKMNKKIFDTLAMVIILFLFVNSHICSDKEHIKQNNNKMGNKLFESSKHQNPHLDIVKEESLLLRRYYNPQNSLEIIKNSASKKEYPDELLFEDENDKYKKFNYTILENYSNMNKTESKSNKFFLDNASEIINKLDFNNNTISEVPESSVPSRFNPNKIFFMKKSDGTWNTISEKAINIDKNNQNTYFLTVTMILSGLLVTILVLALIKYYKNRKKYKKDICNVGYISLEEIK